jgi:alpha-L-fucosidase
MQGFGMAENIIGKGDLVWWQQARFGMFIHWGLYSQPARHEWVRHYEKIPTEAYQKYFDVFCPDLYDPKAWAKAAKEAGMKYFVITAKHHEGFCLWDTKYTDYKITNTAFKRDALKEMVEAFRSEGLHVGLYYSLIDWHHPDFTVDRVHPMRDSAEEMEKNKQRDMKKYAKYMRDQVTELLTNYGKIDILWFDFSYPGENGKDHNDWESEKLIRKLQPKILLDNRLDIPNAGDFETPEQYVPSTGLKDSNGKPIPWEGCQTFSGSWGYHRDETTWKSTEMLVGMLISHVSRGGNLLLNVGPTARGVFDKRALERLSGIGAWMKYNDRSIYGCGCAPDGLVAPENCQYTYNPKTNRLYLHFFAWPFKAVHLTGLAGKVKYSQFLHDASEVFFRESQNSIHEALNERSPKGALTLELPTPKPDSVIPVIELFLK